MIEYLLKVKCVLSDKIYISQNRVTSSYSKIYTLSRRKIVVYFVRE